MDKYAKAISFFFFFFSSSSFSPLSEHAPRTTKFLKLIHFAASGGENVKKFLP